MLVSFLAIVWLMWLWLVLKDIPAGRVGMPGCQVSRQEQRRTFWLIVGAHVALTAAFGCTVLAAG